MRDSQAPGLAPYAPQGDVLAREAKEARDRAGLARATTATVREEARAAHLELARAIDTLLLEQVKKAAVLANSEDFAHTMGPEFPPVMAKLIEIRLKDQRLDMGEATEHVAMVVAEDTPDFTKLSEEEIFVWLELKKKMLKA